MYLMDSNPIKLIRIKKTCDVIVLDRVPTQKFQLQKQKRGRQNEMFQKRACSEERKKDKSNGKIAHSLCICADVLVKSNDSGKIYYQFNKQAHRQPSYTPATHSYGAEEKKKKQCSNATWLNRLMNQLHLSKQLTANEFPPSFRLYTLYMRAHQTGSK